MDTIAVIISLFEIFLCCLGGAILIYRPGLRISETISSGIVIAFMMLSVIYQVSFLIRIPNLSYILEILLFVWIVYRLKRTNFNIAFLPLPYIKKFISQHNFFILPVAFVWIYLFFQAVILPPGNWDSMTYNLARVLLFQQEKSLFLKEVSTVRQAIFPVGADILHYTFLRFNTDYGIGIFSLLAYLSIVLGTYALSRKYVSQEIALTATLVILSLPELVYQATSTKNDIITIAAAIFCFLTVFHILEKFTITDVIFLILAILFGISAKTTFLAFAIPFIVFFGVLLVKKYGLKFWFKSFFQSWRYFLVFLVPFLILSQIWLFIYNHHYWGTWSGTLEYATMNRQTDGLKGAIANLVRYLFNSLDLLEPSNILFRVIIASDISDLLKKIYDNFFRPILSNYGIGVLGDFRIYWTQHEDFSWFGPWGFFIVIPAIFFSLLRGPKFLKTVSLTLLGYLFIIAYTLVWNRWISRYLSLFFVASGVCVAYLIKSLEMRKLSLNIIRCFSIFILLFACTFNSAKPLFTSFNKPLTGSDLLPLKWGQAIMNESIWSQTELGRKRLFYAEKYYGDTRVLKFNQLVPPGSQVALVAREDSWVYPYLLHSHQVKFTPVELSSLTNRGSDFDYILCLDVKCNAQKISSLINVQTQTIWSSRLPARIGKLIQLNSSAT